MHTPQKSNPGCHSCMWIQLTLSLSKLTDSSFIDTQRFIQSLSDIPNVFVSPLISTLVSFITISLSNDLDHGFDNARDLLVVCHLSSCYPKHLHNLEYSHSCSKAPPEVRTVELYGSWDNFANGYFLQHDLQKGCGNWTGVPHFPRIICDGDRPNWSKPRSGALKQGGRYWYYVGCL